jgi:hypothetical protein
MNTALRSEGEKLDQKLADLFKQQGLSAPPMVYNMKGKKDEA